MHGDTDRIFRLQMYQAVLRSLQNLESGELLLQRARTHDRFASGDITRKHQVLLFVEKSTSFSRRPSVRITPRTGTIQITYEHWWQLMEIVEDLKWLVCGELSYVRVNPLHWAATRFRSRSHLLKMLLLIAVSLFGITVTVLLVPELLSYYSVGVVLSIGLLAFEHLGPPSRKFDSRMLTLFIAIVLATGGITGMFGWSVVFSWVAIAGLAYYLKCLLEMLLFPSKAMSLLKLNRA